MPWRESLDSFDEERPSVPKAPQRVWVQEHAEIKIDPISDSKDGNKKTLRELVEKIKMHRDRFYYENYIMRIEGKDFKHFNNSNLFLLIAEFTKEGPKFPLFNDDFTFNTQFRKYLANKAPEDDLSYRSFITNMLNRLDVIEENNEVLKVLLYLFFQENRNIERISNELSIPIDVVRTIVDTINIENKEK